MPPAGELAAMGVNVSDWGATSWVSIPEGRRAAPNLLVVRDEAVPVPVEDLGQRNWSEAQSDWANQPSFPKSLQAS
jgi:hypothetical protein